MHLSCTDANASLQMERREIPNDPRHLGVPSGPSKTISEPMVCSTQTVHLSCIKIITISKWTKMSFHLSLVTLLLPLGASKTIYQPMVHLAQTMHLSCTDTNTVSKQKEERFHMIHTSPRSSFGSIQNDFRAYGMFDANGAPILHQD